jgi:hypothetical protein
MNTYRFIFFSPTLDNSDKSSYIPPRKGPAEIGPKRSLTAYMGVSTASLVRFLAQALEPHRRTYTQWTSLPLTLQIEHQSAATVASPSETNSTSTKSPSHRRSCHPGNGLFSGVKVQETPVAFAQTPLFGKKGLGADWFSATFAILWDR